MDYVEIYPAFNALYYSVFLAGLISTFGHNRFRFTTKGFPRFGHDCLALRVSNASGERKLFFEAFDSPDVEPHGLEWCDVLGKVNYAPELIPPEHRHKVAPVGPVFPVRLWGPARTSVVAVQNLIRANSRLASYRVLHYDPRYVPQDISMVMYYAHHLAHYARIFYHGRLPPHRYVPGRTRDNYVFFSSGLWAETHPVPQWAAANRKANQSRQEFIRACRELDDIRFEGGFWERKRVRVTGYEELTSPVVYPHAEYIRLTQQSSVVFNTPAYKLCHSWKLGEFLALGKAIISLPLVRGLPAPLEHGTHIHYVDGSGGAIQEAVRRISGDRDYRRHLETNARAYFEAYLEPGMLVQRLLARDTSSAIAVAGESAGIGGRAAMPH